MSPGQNEPPRNRWGRRNCMIDDREAKNVQTWVAYVANMVRCLKDLDPCLVMLGGEAPMGS